MTEHGNGGPAFPRTSNSTGRGAQEGMCLRDYFAAKCVAAMVSTISDEDGYGRAVSIASSQGLTVSQWFARESYKQADAMLQERAK